MLSLAEFQAGVRAGVVGNDMSKVAPLLRGGRDPVARFAIHRRHYETSLASALAEKFPATVWLVGPEFVAEAARQFVRRHPPNAPCIAEYGAGFPEFLAARPGAERVPWLRWTSKLEWHLGHAAIELERPRLAADAVAAIEPEHLLECVLRLQPGLRYLAAPWPVDELVTLYLSDEPAPERYTLDPRQVFLEIRGSRGAFAIERLGAAPFAFRSLLADGLCVADAAERAMEIDKRFDAGVALATMLAAGLVTEIVHPDPVGTR